MTLKEMAGEAEDIRSSLACGSETSLRNDLLERLAKLVSELCEELDAKSKS